ncbi:uncharacterized protein LOC142233466 [Haematobia irritans]|uniref:uncharacterized protein LOC142233466 n=1 Tax=Haematobia irritans TaxID=7368 RepID=UPI003F501991
MANSYEPDTESDEDCEVYFLKPVNEYNIVDKIKEANKELFAYGADGDLGQVENDDQTSPLVCSRKVSFAINLEVYEPQSGISLQELEKKLGKDPTGSEEEQEPNKESIKLEVINEEEATIDTEDIKKSEDQSDHSKEEPGIESRESQDPWTTMEPLANDEAIEEICEEILVMDMESGGVTNVTTTTTSSMAYESPSTLQRKILKQITFDCDDEQDNKSLTNLLISDNENDDDDNEEEEGEMVHKPQEDFLINDPNDDDHYEFDYNEPLLEEHSDNEENQNYHYHSENNDNHQDNENDDNADDDDDDDKLSIIVASYLPDDGYDCDDKASLTSSNKCSNHNHHPSFRNRHKIPSFRNRFSFKRKTNPSNMVASSTHNNNNRFQPPPEVTDLKLHYKTCCEFKNAQQKLPKYTGYLSEYGLSRDQLLEREQKLQTKQRSLLQQTLKTSEDEMRKMHDNERAFTKWLKNKMRFPLNKTRNMFDVKRPFGLRKCTSVSSGTATTVTLTQNQQQQQHSLVSMHQVNGDNRHNNQIPHTTRYRSISAKFRKK